MKVPLKVIAFFKEFEFLNDFIRPEETTDVRVKIVDVELLDRVPEKEKIILLNSVGKEIARVGRPGFIKNPNFLWRNPFTWFRKYSDGERVREAIERVLEPDRLRWVLMLNAINGDGIFSPAGFMGWDVTVYRSPKQSSLKARIDELIELEREQFNKD